MSLGGRVKLEMAYLRQVVSCVFLLLITLVFIIILSTPVQCRAMARSCRDVSLLLIALVFIIILSTPVQCRAMAVNSNANEKTDTACQRWQRNISGVS